MTIGLRYILWSEIHVWKGKTWLSCFSFSQNRHILFPAGETRHVHVCYDTTDNKSSLLFSPPFLTDTLCCSVYQVSQAEKYPQLTAIWKKIKRNSGEAGVLRKLRNPFSRVNRILVRTDFSLMQQGSSVNWTTRLPVYSAKGLINSTKQISQREH